MKLVKVLRPFHMKATNTDHDVNDEIKVTDEQLAKIRAVNVNMVLVLGEAEEEEEAETEKPKRTRKKK